MISTQYLDSIQYLREEMYFCKAHSVYNLQKHLHAGQLLPGVSLFLQLKCLQSSRHYQSFFGKFLKKNIIACCSFYRSSKFLAEFAVVVAADNDIVLVIIFEPSLAHFEFSFGTFLPNDLSRLFLLNTLMFHFQVFQTSLFVLLLLLLVFIFSSQLGFRRSFF